MGAIEKDDYDLSIHQFEMPVLQVDVRDQEGNHVGAFVGANYANIDTRSSHWDNYHGNRDVKCDVQFVDLTPFNADTLSFANPCSDEPLEVFALAKGYERASNEVMLKEGEQVKIVLTMKKVVEKIAVEAQSNANEGND